jgi:hypothetical protein
MALVEPSPAATRRTERGLVLSRVWTAALTAGETTRLIAVLSSEPRLREDLEGLLRELPERHRQRLVVSFAARLCEHEHSRDAVLPALEDMLRATVEAATRLTRPG